MKNAERTDRGEAVNLARSIHDRFPSVAINPRGIRVLADAVLKMDAALRSERQEPMERVKLIERAVENAANELDQLFRQRHKMSEVEHLLKRLVYRCCATTPNSGDAK